MSKVLAALMLVVATLVNAGTIPITTRGQIVPSRQTGVLMNDLACGQKWGLCRACATCFPVIDPPVPCGSVTDCPDPIVNDCYWNGVDSSVGVTVEPGARLKLNGHSISGAHVGVSGRFQDGSVPKGSPRIKVLGPGTISGTSEGINSAAAATVTGVALHDNWSGFYGYAARLRNVDASGNSAGVTVDELRAVGLIADGNRYAGVFSYDEARIVRSHLTGNGGADIATLMPPRVRTTVCDHSAGLVVVNPSGIFGLTGPPWGVCSGD